MVKWSWKHPLSCIAVCSLWMLRINWCLYPKQEVIVATNSMDMTKIFFWSDCKTFFVKHNTIVFDILNKKIIICKRDGVEWYWIFSKHIFLLRLWNDTNKYLCRLLLFYTHVLDYSSHISLVQFKIWLWLYHGVKIYPSAFWEGCIVISHCLIESESWYSNFISNFSIKSNTI